MMLLVCSRGGLTAPPLDGCRLGDVAMGPLRADTVTQTCRLVPCHLPAVYFFKCIFAFCLCGVNTISHCWLLVQAPALLAWTGAMDCHHPMELYEDHMAVV